MNYNDIKLTPELMRKAGECTNAEQLIALGEENCIDITRDKAEEIMKSLNGELNDADLEIVAGGSDKELKAYRGDR